MLNKFLCSSFFFFFLHFFAFGLYYRKMKVLCGVARKVGVREEEWTRDMTQVRLEPL